MNNNTKVSTSNIETCSFESCKKKVHLISFTCDYCNKKYCIKHRLPEVHNCQGKKEVDIEKISNELRCVKDKIDNKI